MLLKSIDIHNHLLPGVDDGFGSAEESLEAIRLLAAEYMICADFEKDIAKRAGGLLCYEDRSVLVEMSYLFRSPNLEAALFELQMAGFREDYPVSCPPRLLRLRRHRPSLHPPAGAYSFKQSGVSAEKAFYKIPESEPAKS